MLLGADVPPVAVHLTLGADVLPSGSPMFTPGGRPAVGSTRVAGNGRTAPQRSQSTRGEATAVG
jgi:hypothetical protein